MTREGAEKPGSFASAHEDPPGIGRLQPGTWWNSGPFGKVQVVSLSKDKVRIVSEDAVFEHGGRPLEEIGKSIQINVKTFLEAAVPDAAPRWQSKGPETAADDALGDLAASAEALRAFAAKQETGAPRAAQPKEVAEPVHEVPTVGDKEAAWVVWKLNGVPGMIPNAMRGKLENIGFTGEQVRNMTPIQANFIMLGGGNTMAMDPMPTASEKAPAARQERPAKAPRPEQAEMTQEAKEGLVRKASTFEELYAAVAALGPVQGSKQDFDSASVRRRIEKVRSGESPLNVITSTYGLRDAVQRLTRKEQPQQPQPKAPRQEARPATPEEAAVPAEAAQGVQPLTGPAALAQAVRAPAEQKKAGKQPKAEEAENKVKGANPLVERTFARDAEGYRVGTFGRYGKYPIEENTIAFDRDIEDKRMKGKVTGPTYRPYENVDVDVSYADQQESSVKGLIERLTKEGGVEAFTAEADKFYNDAFERRIDGNAFYSPSGESPTKRIWKARTAAVALAHELVQTKDPMKRRELARDIQGKLEAMKGFSKDLDEELRWTKNHVQENAAKDAVREKAAATAAESGKDANKKEKGPSRKRRAFGLLGAFALLQSLGGVGSVPRPGQGESHSEAGQKGNETGGSPKKSGPETAASNENAAESASVELTHAEITRGQGAEHAIHKLQLELRKMYPGKKMDAAPKNIQTFVGKHPHTLAMALEFYKSTGESRTMHVGDRFNLDTHGILTFHDATEKPPKPITLMNAKGELGHVTTGHYHKYGEQAKTAPVKEAAPAAHHASQHHAAEANSVEPAPDVVASPDATTGTVANVAATPESATPESPTHRVEVPQKTYAPIAEHGTYQEKKQQLREAISSLENRAKHDSRHEPELLAREAQLSALERAEHASSRITEKRAQITQLETRAKHDSRYEKDLQTAENELRALEREAKTAPMAAAPKPAASPASTDGTIIRPHSSGALSTEEAVATLARGPESSGTVIRVPSADRSIDRVASAFSSSDQGPVIRANSSTLDELASARRFSVNPEAPGKYKWHVPGVLADQTFAYGGNEKQASEVAKEYVTKHPGTTMYFLSKDGKRVSSWSSDSVGRTKRASEALNAEGKPLRVPTSNEFIAPITD